MLSTVLNILHQYENSIISDYRLWYADMRWRSDTQETKLGVRKNLLPHTQL